MGLFLSQKRADGTNRVQDGAKVVSLQVKYMSSAKLQANVHWWVCHEVGEPCLRFETCHLFSRGLNRYIFSSPIHLMYFFYLLIHSQSRGEMDPGCHEGVEMFSTPSRDHLPSMHSLSSILALQRQLLQGARQCCRIQCRILRDVIPSIQHHRERLSGKRLFTCGIGVMIHHLLRAIHCMRGRDPMLSRPGGVVGQHARHSAITSWSGPAHLFRQQHREWGPFGNSWPVMPNRSL
jgi:hypothetical protein